MSDYETRHLFMNTKKVVMTTHGNLDKISLVFSYLIRDLELNYLI